MEHTPYGYDIIGGRAVINEGQAANIRQICENYLSGMSFKNAAAAVGLSMSHCGVKRLMLNKQYVGDSFYPPILTKDTAQKVEAERLRREKAFGRDGRKGKGVPVGTIITKFTAPKITLKYDDPVRQAEYAYTQIRSEVNE